MRPSRLCLILFTALIATLRLACAAPTDDNPAAALAAALEARRQPLQLADGVLQGAGAARLLADARAAQFVLVGEDHGFADVPAFTLALQRALAPAALVMEIGPHSAARVERALRADPQALARLQATHPFAVPFLCWREYAALAGAAVGAPAPALWGIDQEFVLSPRLHFARLAELAPDADARRLAEDYRRRDAEAYRTLVERRDPGAALLPRLREQDFAALRGAFAGAAPEARALIDALADSAALYRGQSTDPYASNRDRAKLMKRAFMTRYVALAARQPQPRVLFHMGAYHVGRGRSPTDQYDVGNLAAELAESTGARSYHVLVLAAGGRVNRWLPFAPDAALKQADYDAHAELDPLGAGPLLDHALRGSWTLFDLAAMRDEPALRKAGGPAFDRLVFAYDAVVVIDVAQPARFFGD
ncbi:MAG: hypothetical protein GXC76_15745 [Rhodanobacteraceae bacterium]|jgi:hypothetical protein|nr:hypothetical protein [Rhodanobacteraceae bacterium]